MWESDTYTHLRTFGPQSTKLMKCTWAPDGSVVLSCGLDGTLKTYKVANGINTHSLTGHVRHVSPGIFSPNGNIICSAAEDGFLKLWK